MDSSRELMLKTLKGRWVIYHPPTDQVLCCWDDDIQEQKRKVIFYLEHKDNELLKRCQQYGYGLVFKRLKENSRFEFKLYDEKYYIPTEEERRTGKNTDTYDKFRWSWISGREVLGHKFYE